MNTKNLYVSSRELAGGGLGVCTGLIPILKQKFQKVALFIPIISEKTANINSIDNYFNLSLGNDFYALKLDEAQELIASNKTDEVYDIVIKKYKNLEEKYDFVLILGINNDAFNANLNFDINIQIAKNLNAPFLNIINGKNKTKEQIILEAKMDSNKISSQSCSHFATFITRLAKEDIEAFKTCTCEKNTLIVLLPKARDIHSQNAQNAIENINCTLLYEEISQNSGINSDEKIKIILDMFSEYVDEKQVLSTLLNTSSNIVTPLMFQYQLFENAKSQTKKIVLPESEDPRILQATQILLDKKVVEVVLLGDEQKILDDAQKLNLNIQHATIIDPKNSSYKEEFANTFYELRKSKGISLQEATKTIEDYTYFATMMVHLGYADGMVSGAVNTTANTIRPALQIIKTKPNISIVSSVFFMCLDTQVLVFGDCAVNPSPTPEQLAQIALTSAQTTKLFGIEPKVAMLSYSTGTSGLGEEVEKVLKATQIAQELDKDLLVDGPLQYDAAVDISVGSKKLPGSKVAGQASVFIFPDLNTGNNTYKAVQRSAKALAIGPVLQGINKPINDLSRGCLVEDIVNTVAITAIQAQGDN